MTNTPFRCLCGCSTFVWCRNSLPAMDILFSQPSSHQNWDSIRKKRKTITPFCILFIIIKYTRNEKHYKSTFILVSVKSEMATNAFHLPPGYPARPNMRARNDQNAGSPMFSGWSLGHQTAPHILLQRILYSFETRRTIAARKFFEADAIPYKISFCLVDVTIAAATIC